MHENNLKVGGLGLYVSLRSHEVLGVFLLPAALLFPALAFPSWSKMAAHASSILSPVQPEEEEGTKEEQRRMFLGTHTLHTALPTSQSPELYHVATPR